MIYAESWGGLVGRIQATVEKLTPEEIDDACSIDPVPVDSPFKNVSKGPAAPVK
jgi:hypothetical protein